MQLERAHSMLSKNKFKGGYAEELAKQAWNCCS